jgi:hypothetical protein
MGLRWQAAASPQFKEFLLSSEYTELPLCSSRGWVSSQPGQEWASGGGIFFDNRTENTLLVISRPLIKREPQENSGSNSVE